MKHRWRLALLCVTAGAACDGRTVSSTPDAGNVPLADAAPRPDVIDYDAAILCDADYAERRDDRNDPLSYEDDDSEGTGLFINTFTAPRTVCGALDPQYATDVRGDGDVFHFALEGDEPVSLRFEMEVAGAGPDDILYLHVYRSEAGLVRRIGIARYRRDFAVLVARDLEPGIYWIAPIAEQPATDAALDYTVTISREHLDCPASEEAAAYVEAADDGDSRGNDMVAIAYPDAPALTDDTGDAAEPTGLTLLPETPLRISGQSGLVSSAGDSYLDRDSYLLATAADTTEVELRLTWPDGDVDLDVYVFAAGDPSDNYSVGQGVTVGETDDEVVVINVDPSSNYWLWIGAYDTSEQDGATMLPMAYDVTVCPRTHGAVPTPR